MLVSVDKNCLSYQVSGRTNCFIGSFYFSLCFYFIDLSHQHAFISSLHVLHVIISFCFRAFRYAVKLLLEDLARFVCLLVSPSCMNFSLRPSFMVSHKIGSVVSFIVFNVRKISISFFLSLPNFHSVKSSQVYKSF